MPLSRMRISRSRCSPLQLNSKGASSSRLCPLVPLGAPPDDARDLLSGLELDRARALRTMLFADAGVEDP